MALMFCFAIPLLMNVFSVLLSSVCLTVSAVAFVYFMPESANSLYHSFMQVYADYFMPVKHVNRLVLTHLGATVPQHDRLSPLLFIIDTQYGEVNLATDCTATFSQLATLLTYMQAMYLVKPLEDMTTSNVVFLHDLGTGSLDIMNALFTASAIAEETGNCELSRSILYLVGEVNHLSKEQLLLATDLGIYLPWLMTVLFAERIDILYTDPEAVSRNIAAIRELAKQLPSFINPLSDLCAAASAADASYTNNLELLRPVLNALITLSRQSESPFLYPKEATLTILLDELLVYQLDGAQIVYNADPFHVRMSV